MLSLQTKSQLSNESTKFSDISVFLISLGLGIFLFFQQSEIDLFFDGNTAYSDFSKNIYKENTSYFAESILLPLIAKIFGASTSLHAYKIFCSFITILILPLLSIAAYKYFETQKSAFIFVFLIIFFFPWFRTPGLGQPDPLTIMFLMLGMLQKHSHKMFWCIFGASLSHFSLVLVSMPSILAFLIATSTLNRSQKVKFVKLALLALLLGKLFLSFWNFIFSYQLGTRTDWILERWPWFFIDRYENDPLAFWLTPTLPFLFIFFAIGIYFLFIRKFALFFAQLLLLISIYVANFITIDGYRIVAVIISAPITIIIREIIYLNNYKFILIINRYIHYITKFNNYLILNWANISSVLIITSAWAYLISSATKVGLTLNQFTTVSFFDHQIDMRLLLVAIGFIFNIVFLLNKNLSKPIFQSIVQLIFVIPLVVIGLQLIRRIFFLDESLPLLVKAIFIVVLFAAIIASIRVKIIRSIFDQINYHLTLIFR